MTKKTLFDAIGGLPAMTRIHTDFYDKMYAHPWLGQFFIGHDQQIIELRQTQFMAEKMGSKSVYPGRELEVAHRRMYLSKELLKLRQRLLRQSIEEEGIAEEFIQRWLKIDMAFWGKIKNESIEQFNSVDLKYEQALIVEKPAALEPSQEIQRFT